MRQVRLCTCGGSIAPHPSLLPSPSLPMGGFSALSILKTGKVTKSGSASREEAGLTLGRSWKGCDRAPCCLAAVNSID